MALAGKSDIGQKQPPGNDRFRAARLTQLRQQDAKSIALMLRIQVLQSDEPTSCDLVVTNEGPSALWNVWIPVNEISLDIFFLDDTHMPEELRLPAIQLQRIGVGETARFRQGWGLTGSKRLSGNCWIAFSDDEAGALRRRESVPFTVDLGTSRS